MNLPSNWKPVTSADGALEYYARDCGGYRVFPMYHGRWHACERLTDDGWLEWAGKEKLRDAMAVCGRHAQQVLESTSAEGAGV